MISNSPIGHTGERASSTEMEKVNRLNTTPRPDTHGSATPKQLGFLKAWHAVKVGMICNYLNTYTAYYKLMTWWLKHSPLGNVQPS
jgi:hypothetical protein